jgi:RNA polymerase sigma factor (sigma-70 family)
MLAAVPSLRAFAISLSGNVDRADDLVQETLLCAIANINLFHPGTNMSAWLITILRNLFRSEYRKRRREVQDAAGSYAESLKSHPNQHSRVELEEFRVALAKLPSDQREALLLVGASGVGSRFVVAGTGAMLIVVGALPKFTALIASMPSTVLGAGLVMTFGMIAAEGVRRAGPYMFSARNAAVLTLGLVPAVSLRTLPQSFLARIPQELAPLLTDALVTGLLIALLAHLLLPGGSEEFVPATEQRPGNPTAAQPVL